MQSYKNEIFRIKNKFFEIKALLVGFSSKMEAVAQQFGEHNKDQYKTFSPGNRNMIKLLTDQWPVEQYLVVQPIGNQSPRKKKDK